MEDCAQVVGINTIQLLGIAVGQRKHLLIDFVLLPFKTWIREE
jgi:hypothetical protein